MLTAGFLVCLTVILRSLLNSGSESGPGLCFFSAQDTSSCSSHQKLEILFMSVSPTSPPEIHNQTLEISCTDTSILAILTSAQVAQSHAIMQVYAYFQVGSSARLSPSFYLKHSYLIFTYVALKSMPGLPFWMLRFSCLQHPLISPHSSLSLHSLYAGDS